MKTQRTIGNLLITGAIGILVPYTMLTVIFDYPGILRQDPGVILVRFHEGGSRLVLTWWAFAMLGLPLLPAFIMLGQATERRVHFMRVATTVGVIGLFVQVVGLLRWTFVVPVLSGNFVRGNESTREASKVAFQVVHQYGGVLLGEHLGQLFTIAWTMMVTRAFQRRNLFPGWIIWLGYISSCIYFLAQTEIFATVIPAVPVVDIAGFLGSTLWILWLLIVGIKLRNVSIG